MRKPFIYALILGCLVVLASRLAELMFRVLGMHPVAVNAAGMAVAWFASSVLFFHIFMMQRQKRLVAEERERMRAHIHHHVRNALYVITLAHSKDPVTMSQVDRIVDALEYVLPSNASTETDRLSKKNTVPTDVAELTV